MPNQTTRGQYVASDGLNLAYSADSGVTFSDIGAYTGAVTITPTGDVAELFTSNAGRTPRRWINPTVTVAPGEIYTWDADAIRALSSGFFSRTAVAGTPVVGGTQVILPAYSYDIAIGLDGQNATGAKPTSISVDQETAVGSGVYTTALTEGTDYHIVRNESGVWSIVIIDSATVDNTLGVQVTSSYTPATGSILTGGTTDLELVPYQLRLRHYTDLSLGTYDFEAILYNVTIDPGSLVLTKNGAESTGFDSYTLGFTANLDTTRANGEQLIRIFQAA